MRSQEGQASAEWVALLAVVAVLLSASGAVAAVTGAAVLPRAIRCALLAGCVGEDARLGRAYTGDAAAYVRAFAPNLVYEKDTLVLPGDFRSCRSHGCADAAGKGGSDVWRSRRGRPATAFTHVVDRRPRGSLYVQYWLYYPDSTYNGTARAVGGAPVIKHTPLGFALRGVGGFHRDDWESYQVRIDPSGEVWSRASAHGGYAGAKKRVNPNELPRPKELPWLPARTGAWTPATGWTRVSRGSHAGHIVREPGGERRTEADGLRLIAVEDLSPASRAHVFAVTPPWEKRVYREPEHTGT